MFSDSELEDESKGGMFVPSDMSELACSPEDTFQIPYPYKAAATPKKAKIFSSRNMEKKLPYIGIGFEPKKPLS